MTTGMEMLGRPVIEEGTGRTLGLITDVLLDDGCRRVVGLVAERRRPLRRRILIAFDAVRVFGPEVVIAAGPRRSSLDDRSTPGRDGAAVEGKPVVTDDGHVLGAVSDVLFDERDGQVTGFEVRQLTPRCLSRRRAVLPAHVPLVVADVIIVPHRRRRGCGTVPIH